MGDILTKLQIDRSPQVFELERRPSSQKASIFYEKFKNQYLVNILATFGNIFRG